MRRPLLVLTLLSAVATALPAVPASADAPASAEAPIAWAPCAEDPTAECGTLTVPVDWSRPAGETFQLALARRRASDPSARIGSMVINPGGPGGSGVDAVVDKRLTFTPEISRRFDVVGFDPRGVARSHPITCSYELATQAPDPLELKSQAEFDALLAHNERYRRDCRARTGPLFDHVDTGSVVRDLDALRAALGEDKLTYYGVSYGTLIGQLYAERYPRRVRALALDSDMDHSLGTTAFLDTEAWSSQDSFDEFVSWCERTASCALHGKDVRAVWRGLLERAARGELPLPGLPDVKLTRLDLISQAFGAFYGPAYKELAEFLAALDGGTGTARPIMAPPADDPPETVNDASQVFCQDYLLPVRDYREYARHLRRSAAIAPDMLVSAAAHPLTAACLGQPAPIPDPQHRLRVDGSPTLLLGNALHDPATPYPWAVDAALQIGREARLLTYEGWGHRIYGRGDCPTQAFDAYLIARTVPAKGARCPAVPPAEVTSLADRRPIGPLPGLPGYTSDLAR
ncbi:alpha/beta fold hydrolase [Nonomuraea roseoviolacea]|uniref:Pimeloyl-ACP methyl ester carboxylesterase n=1 Tax=Nonomuraea roseoviolacea subsp. carminata TaxID=160689 RepID=A0ABT1JS10_9ACTN|nr:alpha/beta fold hydrolase [Nonomuraea roseoviolacea]MCP2344109.1 pimeloyl-ACP methyl ester carboxylesterase [Nonomuraea roseoviolacea subsp. carminata]